MNADNTRSNYTEDRSSNFKHHVPSDIAPPGVPTVQDYVQYEKSKQMSKMRDWYLESKNARTETLTERTDFSTSRSFCNPSPAQELDRHKGFLIAGAVIAGIIGGVMYFGHF